VSAIAYKGKGKENFCLTMLIFRWWDLRSMGKTNELKFDEPITSMERSSSSLGELLTVTSGKKVFFLDLHK
jgi:hypothetical protein